MNEIQAKELIKDTFENSFDEEKFQNFIINLFKKNYTLDQKEIKGTFIPDAYEEFISKYKRILKYEVPELNQRIDVLIVYLNKSISLDRARTTQRNFIRDYLLGKIFSDTLKDAALVAFVSPQLDDWRFSFVKLEHRYDPQKKKIIDETTPAKRYSFLVGKNEKSHTAQAQILPVLLNDDLKIDISYLEKNVFNIETVTEEFFNDYRDLLISLKLKIDEQLRYNSSIALEFQNKNINSVDFAKKLLGQIVFLYFLQKKGWFGVQKNQNWGTGPKNFFRKLFNKEFCNYNNFFNDILEPLFYEALRTDRSFYDHYFSMLNCKIPFLNGGLFDPIGKYDWVNVDIHLPDELFSNNIKTKNGDIGNGILDVFDRYNFTINEDEPLEKEVALDPELLGKIYEKLNAINSNNFDDYIQKIKSGNEFEFNKANGVYYTPRKIVHFICQETLIHYIYNEMNKTIPLEDIEKFVYHTESIFDRVKESLKKADKPYTKYKYINLIPDSIKNNAHQIDKLLSDVKVCDPAVGSGAFPVGMMIEIVRLREFLSLFINDDNRTHYNFKRHCIENSLYGVDIDPGAVEICKLRFWLSLIVDEDDFYSIKPLPNLDYKIVCGNSLLSVEKNLLNNDVILELEKLKTQFFNETNPNEKEKLREKISKLIKDITAGHSEFDFELYFSEVFHSKGGFDIVIGNPPYIGEKGHKELFYKVKQYKLGKYYLGKMDYFYFFFHLALNIAKNNGIISYITTNYFLTATGAKKLREDLKQRSIILHIINFNELKIFKSATGQHNMITILQKGQDQTAIAQTCITKRKGFANPEVLESILNGQDKETQYYQVSQNDLYDGVEYYIRLTSNSIISKNDVKTILDKIKEQGYILGLICKINSGADVTISKITKKHMSKFKGNFNLGDGVFVLEPKDIDNLKLTKDEEFLLKPYIKNSDIYKFAVKPTDEKLIYLRWDDNINKYPNIKNHLLKFKEILEDQQNRYEEKYPWYALHRPREQSIFEASDKILVPYRNMKNIFGYTISPIYSSRDVFFITEKDKSVSLKYILALLNSKIYYLWLYHRGKRKGETLELYQKPLSEIPIKKINEVEQKPFIDLVDKILAITKDDDYLQNQSKQAKVKEYERQIDQMVYKLYGLTDEEIKIIEESVKDNKK